MQVSERSVAGHGGVGEPRTGASTRPSETPGPAALARLPILAGSTLLGPVVWSADLAYHRLQQLSHVADAWHAKRHRGSRLYEASAASRAAAESCGLVLRARRHHVVCPLCSAEAARLLACLDGERPYWGCASCQDISFPQIEVVLADYSFACAIGLRGGYIRARQERLAVELREVLATGATAEHAYYLAAGGLLLQQPTGWPKPERPHPKGMRPSARVTLPLGPMWHRLAPLLVEAVLDVRLHPTAYLLRRFSEEGPR